jgi:cyanophycin synthetase
VNEHADNAVPAGRLLIIGGGEDRCCGAGVLERFVELSGGDQARITLVTTATGIPDEVHAEYEQVFRKLGVEQTRELRLRGGTVVLNADDPRSAGLAQRTPVRERNPVVRFFSLSGSSPVIMAHRMSGGIACLLRDGQLIEARGGEETVLLHTGELPGSFGGAATHLVANALAPAAACRALGVSVKDIRRGFATFTPAEANPGRGHVYQVGGVPLVVDYGHNPAALASMGRLLREAWDGQPIAAITLPGDRRDDLIEESAAAVATWFSRVVIYEDRDLRGREAGEMTRLISGALARHRPDIQVRPADGPEDALRCALALAAPSDPVLLTYEKLGPVRDLLAGLGATAWPA